MNQDKAREFFSAYYEGTLETGLRQTLEHRLRTDAVLQAEYRAFEDTFAQLDSLRDEEIEVPMWLSDRIATRLEAVQETRRPVIPALSLWLRGLAFSGVAGLAIFGAVKAIGDRTPSTVGGASAISRTSGPLTVSAGQDGVVLNYAATGKQVVTVSSALTGSMISRFELNNERLESPLQNANATTALFKVQAPGQDNATIVAVPGTTAERKSSGESSLQEFAAALAGRFRSTVIVSVADPLKTISWTMPAGNDAFSAANEVLASRGYNVTKMDDGLVRIQDH